MTYQMASELSLSWGLVVLMTVFGAGVLYAMWPSNKRAFDDAARLPLNDEDGQ